MKKFFIRLFKKIENFFGYENGYYIPYLRYGNDPDYIEVGGFEGTEWIKKTDIKKQI